jgi:predicted RNase H-like HicB family nuclease
MAEPETYTVRTHSEPGQDLWTEVLELPGVFAAGADMPELRESLTEAISLYLSEPGAEKRVELEGPARDGDRAARVRPQRLTVLPARSLATVAKISRGTFGAHCDPICPERARSTEVSAAGQAAFCRCRPRSSRPRN